MAGMPWAGSPIRSLGTSSTPADRLIVDHVRANRVPTEAADRMAFDMVRRTGLTMVPRTISIDEAIRAGQQARGQLPGEVVADAFDARLDAARTALVSTT